MEERTRHLSNQGRWCTKCKNCIYEVVNIQIVLPLRKLEGNPRAELTEDDKEIADIYKTKLKIENLFYYCKDCMIRQSKIDKLNDEIEYQQELINSFKKSLKYHKDLKKDFEKQVLSLKWDEE
jgi:hypothetical protein